MRLDKTQVSGEPDPARDIGIGRPLKAVEQGIVNACRHWRARRHKADTLRDHDRQRREHADFRVVDRVHERARFAQPGIHMRLQIVSRRLESLEHIVPGDRESVEIAEEGIHKAVEQARHALGWKTEAIGGCDDPGMEVRQTPFDESAAIEQIDAIRLKAPENRHRQVNEIRQSFAQMREIKNAAATSVLDLRYHQVEAAQAFVSFLVRFDRMHTEMPEADFTVGDEVLQRGTDSSHLAGADDRDARLAGRDVSHRVGSSASSSQITPSVSRMRFNSSWVGSVAAGRVSGTDGEDCLPR